MTHDGCRTMDNHRKLCTGELKTATRWNKNNLVLAEKLIFQLTFISLSEMCVPNGKYQRGYRPIGISGFIWKKNHFILKITFIYLEKSK